MEQGEVTDELAENEIYDPAFVPVPPRQEIWSGIVNLDGFQVIDYEVVIEPGTVVRLGEAATVLFKNKLSVNGTSDQPVQFVAKNEEQDPWGAIALVGPDADNSTFSHCVFENGSGFIEDLFEYSAMLSIHDVKGVEISDCNFKDNHIVDDMVHTVYAEIKFSRVRFDNAVSDALDLDISTAEIEDSVFENNGNDAVDLMTTEAVITNTSFVNNGDKGISVGENSRLQAVNNVFEGNVYGVQSKDRSIAVLYNNTLKDNDTALHAYHKNWRYGVGGVIYASKSHISGGEVPVSAEKRSNIAVLDSYIDNVEEKKRVNYVNVDTENETQASTELTFMNQGFPLELETEIKLLSSKADQYINPNQRGANASL